MAYVKVKSAKAIKITSDLEAWYTQIGQSKVPIQLHMHLLMLTKGKSTEVVVSFEELARAVDKGVAWIKHILKRDKSQLLFEIKGWTHGSSVITIRPLLPKS